MMEEKTKNFAYAIVRNIPKAYHSKDLRSFFSDFVENDRFQCFHFRHRPEIQASNDSGNSSSQRVTNCCVISFLSGEDRLNFIEKYHEEFWADSEDRKIPLKCFVHPIKIQDPSTSEEETLSTDDSRTMLELNPPSLMPKGNVGTPTKYFYQQITMCKLPPSVIRKLGLKPRKRLGKYSAVSMDYLDAGNSRSLERKRKIFAQVNQRYYYDAKTDSLIMLAKKDDPNSDESETSGESGDEDNDVKCEEWERHEALHDDVTEQERTKPRKYEEEQEVTWEKGGPGLVWHMDTFYWKEREEGTDSDWKWADDWDVDYSIYHDRKAGDTDAKHAVEMLEDEKLRSGKYVGTVFRSKSDVKIKKPHFNDSSKELRASEPGDFEKHTKGVGSKILKRFGWRPGQGLGADSRGHSVAVYAELNEVEAAERGVKKFGLGYRGEKLNRSSSERDFKLAKLDEVAKKYSDESYKSNVLRRELPTFMKYRQ